MIFGARRSVPDMLDKLYEYLEGTANTPYGAIVRFDLDMTEDEVIEAMLDRNLEPCPICGWWMESGELINDDLAVVGCQQCRERIYESEADDA